MTDASRMSGQSSVPQPEQSSGSPDEQGGSDSDDRVSTPRDGTDEQPGPDGESGTASSVVRDRRERFGATRLSVVSDQDSGAPGSGADSGAAEPDATGHADPDVAAPGHADPDVTVPGQAGSGEADPGSAESGHRAGTRDDERSTGDRPDYLFGTWSSLHDESGSTGPDGSGLSTGFDRSSPDSTGFDRSGPDSAGFDRSGFDRSGPDSTGFDRSGGYDGSGYSSDSWSFVGDVSEAEPTSPPRGQPPAAEPGERAAKPRRLFGRGRERKSLFPDHSPDGPDSGESLFGSATDGGPVFSSRSGGRSDLGSRADGGGRPDVGGPRFRAATETTDPLPPPSSFAHLTSGGPYGASTKYPTSGAPPTSGGAAYPISGAPSSFGGSAAGSPWWVKDAQADPWRDPGSAPAWVAPSPPPPPGPMLPIRLAPPRSGKNGLGQLLGIALITALLAGLLGGALGFVAATRTIGPDVSLGGSSGNTPGLAKRPPQSIAGIAQRVQPSVVTIDIRSTTGTGNGSGFIISKNGYILTNNHVAEPGTNGGSLTVVFHDGTRTSARVIGSDRGSDVAVVKVDKENLPPVTFADSDKVAVGDPVIAFGSPLGLNGTVTTGIVSALERPVKTGGKDDGEEAYMAAIQTDAAINPGNSGGPLVDGDGRVIGIDSAIATIPGETGKSGSIGLGFAIPINQAKRTAEQLIATGRARTTVMGADLDRVTVFPNGGVRLTVVPDGPAKAAGLQPGDVIMRFNNRVIEDAVDLIALIRKLDPGTKVGLVYQRNGRTATTTITLGWKFAS